ncbi:three prime repair exonuclease 2-like [Antedon mediterranea]|uniref:three prime repair exonuclease 2-like n=1 Tax=Antedon mediterranea TaxID=105859 RepID=UPI003AF62E28
MLGIKDKSASHSLGLGSPPPRSRRMLGLVVEGALTIDDSSNDDAGSGGDESSYSCRPMPTSEKSCSRASTSKQQLDIERDVNVIKSFVFLDLESSALLPCERPKITEICLIAVHRSSINGSTSSTSSPPVIPRVVDKMTLCLYPNKQIHSGDMTGLDNSILLENEKKGFDSNLVDCINAFLNRQTKPVCLVAHNGERFDFPLLKTELNYIDCSLPCDVLCVDSLIAFQDIDDKLEARPENQNNTLPVMSSTSNEHSPSKKRKVSYKLAEIYKRTFGKLPENVHNAEADVVTLIQIVCHHHGVEICNWMDKNAKPWNNIKLYYAPSPGKCSNKFKKLQV